MNAFLLFSTFDYIDLIATSYPLHSKYLRFYVINQPILFLIPGTFNTFMLPSSVIELNSN